MAEKKKIVSGELVYIFPWRFYENCEIDIHEEKNSILIIVRLNLQIAHHLIGEK